MKKFEGKAVYKNEILYLISKKTERLITVPKECTHALLEVNKIFIQGQIIYNDKLNKWQFIALDEECYEILKDNKILIYK